jgi:hypothetical protein
VRPAQWCHGQCGRRSPELRATRLWCSVFGVFSSYGTGGVRGTHQGSLLPREGLQSRTCGSKVQASTFNDSGGTLQGSAHDKDGPNGCGAEHRTPASDRWSSGSIARSVAMKGVNLGFISVFFEIPVQLPSIYRGFGLIISCTCRALSRSSQIQMEFDILFDFVEILASGVSISVMTQRGVGNDQRWATLGLGQAWLGWLGRIRPMAK